MTTWNEFAWAAFLYGSLGGDPYYDALFAKTDFMASLRTNPSALTDDDVRDNLIHFLNQWKTRIAKSIASDFRAAIVHVHPFYSTLIGQKLETTNWEHLVTVSGKQMPISDAVAQSYEQLHAVNGIGPTATAKTLHILVPELLVMWDGYILAELAKTNSAIDSTGKGYVAFLKQAQVIGRDASSDFKRAPLNPPALPQQSIESYLSAQLGYPAGKSLAKFVDEYLWATITSGAIVPPKWHP